MKIFFQNTIFRKFLICLMKISVMLLVSIVFFSTIHPSYSTPDFTYNPFRKDHDFDWQDECKIGKHQSPVNIDTSLLSNEKNTAYIENYDRHVSGNVTYEHHSAKFVFNNTEDVRFITDTRLKYRLHSMHFHVGCTEHSINNKSYSMELHLVHYNSEVTILNAIEDYSSQSISVIAVLFRESPLDNEMLNSVLEMIKDGSTRNKKIKYRNLLPSKLKHAYQYPGSLTTPPCYENVLWHVLDDKATISLNQLNEFKKLHSNHMNSFNPNCRQIKPLNDRKITSIEILSISAAHSFVLEFTVYLRLCFFVTVTVLSKYLLT